MLGQAERHRQHGMQQPEHGPRQGRNKKAGPQVRPAIDGEPADHCTEGHNALDAKVEDTSPLAEQRTRACRE